MFIDTHAHLYLEQFDEDLDFLMAITEEAGVQKVYLPNIDSSSIDAMHRIEAEYPDVLHSMMGLHPCSVKENYKAELKICEEHLSNRKYCAIGEIGIDLYWDKTFHAEQKKAYEIQIEWARDLGIPFVIHSRDSLDETIATVERLQDGNLSGIFHCFNGDEDQARKIQGMGFLIGIGGVITFKNAGVREQLVNLDLDMMVLETDSPYLAPTPFRGKRNQSNYIPIIAEQLAETLEISIEEVARVTTNNAKNLFHTPKPS